MTMKKNAGNKMEDQDNDSQKEEKNAAEKEHKEKEEKTVIIPKEEYEALREKEKELLQQQDRFLRLQAEFDNVRKRLERDKAEFLKFANEEIIGELIPFVDDFQRAFEAADKTKDFNVLHRGVEMILNHLLELLKKKGVAAIEAVGRPFDPAYHEALMQVESVQHPEHTVIEELQKGYLLNNRVLRTAKVKVAKSTETKEEPQVPEKGQKKEEKEKKENAE